MSKNKQPTFTEDTVIGAGVDEDAGFKTIVDADEAPGDTETAITVDDNAAEAVAVETVQVTPTVDEKPPYNGGQYKLVDGKYVPVENV